ncbi:MAG: folate-binding protein YgfZ [Burkholderiaceae bacterium]|nr:folate-binding protein YgfZ [Burkholderiaceae bacterium]
MIIGRTMSDLSLPSPTPTSALDGAVRLADWGLIRAEGVDAASFLHSQLTQDVQGLREGQARLAGWCSAKGRLTASFVIWRDGEHSFWLACSADLLAATLKRLKMFVLRAKCQLSDASATHALWGLAGASALSACGALPAWGLQAGPAGTAIRLPDGAAVPRALWLQPAEAAAPAAAALDAGDWAWLEVSSGVVRIVAATAEQFVPQMVNLELVGGVNFQKGCYPGQEVVARSQYRGTLKRRGQLFDSAAPLAAGQELFHSADPGQPAGLVALAAPAPGGRGWRALVEVKLAALDGGQLHAGSADGALLQRVALPYALPSEP